MTHNEKWEALKVKVAAHVERGNMSLNQSSWLIEEADRVMAELDVLVKRENQHGVGWGEREEINDQQLNLVKTLMELSRRMEIEQERLRDDMAIDLAIMKELDELDKL
jgi:hypothetical protein